MRSWKHILRAGTEFCLPVRTYFSVKHDMDTRILSYNFHIRRGISVNRFVKKVTENYGGVGNNTLIIVK